MEKRRSTDAEDTTTSAPSEATFGTIGARNGYLVGNLSGYRVRHIGFLSGILSGIPKSVFPNRYSQSGIPKAVFPKRYSQSGIPKAVFPNRYLLIGILLIGITNRYSQTVFLNRYLLIGIPKRYLLIGIY